MCGIIGAIGERNITPILMQGLRLLEYRGYDSAGLAIINKNGLIRLRAAGKINQLQAKLDQTSANGTIGIAHTRWATHGKPTETNAHPHLAGEDIAIVHNGIIENDQALRASLIKRGVTFHSDTDSEIIAQIIQQKMTDKDSFFNAVTQTVQALEGAYALAVLNRQDPDTLIVAKKGSPLVIGLGIEENFVASDVLSLAPITNRFMYLEDGDIACITRQKVSIFDEHGQPIERNISTINPDTHLVQKDGYTHFMQKEIHEQPRALNDTFAQIIHEHKPSFDRFITPHDPDCFKRIQRIQIVACGTSYYAGVVAQYWFEQYAKLPVDVDIASEIRYREKPIQPFTLLLVISQSGETADTLGVLKSAKTAGYFASLAICNVSSSNMVRHADFSMITKAGPEIGVASTKAFTTQLMSLYLLMCHLGALQQRLSKDTLTDLCKGAEHCPTLVNNVLALAQPIQELAQTFVHKQHALFLARGSLYPIALEGALKLKEISYINAQAYPTGELKHGPIALIDQDMSVIAIVANNHLRQKVIANLKEVQARGAELIVITEKAVADQLHFADHIISIDLSIPEPIAPILYTIPLQLFAYFVAVAKGTDVDQPRNLAKSVTVE